MKESRLLLAAVLMLSFLMQACASLPAGRAPDPTDPFERYNRAAFSFNDTFDRVLLKPVATAYRAATPEFFRRGVANFFANISDIPTALNEVLQGKPSQAATQLGRVAVNSTFGLLGVLDIATDMGLERQREDFGQTLGVWGVKSGPYLVLPLLGPSTVRDSFALIVDFGTDPLLYVHDRPWRYGLGGLRLVQQRASFLQAEVTLEAIEFDPYLFRRDAYLARRRNVVYDGNPPDEPTERPRSEPDASKQLPSLE